MTRINTNIPSLIAQANLARTNNDLALRLERLATGLRINRGADDPAGLVVAESLRSEARGLAQAVTNAERVSSVVATVEGYLSEVSELLLSIRSLVVQTSSRSGISREEIEANQLQVDSAIDSITRISNVATFAGLQLLNGSLEYVTSGIATSAIAAANIFTAQLGRNAHMPVEVEVITSAQAAGLFLSGNTTGAPGSLLSSVTLEVKGGIGVQTLSFISGTPLANVVQAVNTLREATGVSASLVNAADPTSGLTFNSVGYGSDEFISVRKIGGGGDFFRLHLEKNGSEADHDEGQDVAAAINGTLAIGNGLRVRLNTPSLSLDLDLTVDYAQRLGIRRLFEITGGGATFQLGPEVTFNQQVGLGVQSIAETRLGGVDIGGARYFLESLKSGRGFSLVSGNIEGAAQIIDEAIEEIAVLRGRLGAFERNMVETSIRSLQVGLENITASESRVRDADFAAEAAALTRAQILQQAGTSVLATANITHQQVLALLQ